MELEHLYPKDFTREYLKSRNNIALVIKYLEKLNTNKPSVEVNNDCIRLLMEALTKQSELYLDLNELPLYNAELRLENHVLTVENKKLKQDLVEALRLKF